MRPCREARDSTIHWSGTAVVGPPAGRRTGGEDLADVGARRHRKIQLAGRSGQVQIPTCIERHGVDGSRAAGVEPAQCAGVQQMSAGAIEPDDETGRGISRRRGYSRTGDPKVAQRVYGRGGREVGGACLERKRREDVAARIHFRHRNRWRRQVSVGHRAVPWPAGTYHEVVPFSRPPPVCPVDQALLSPVPPHRLSTQPAPLYHCGVVPNCPSGLAVHSLTGNARFPFQAEPTQRRRVRI